VLGVPPNAPESAISRLRPATERRARTTGIAIQPTAQNGTSGVLAGGKYVRRRATWATPRTGGQGRWQTPADTLEVTVGKPNRTGTVCEFTDREVDQIALVAADEFVPGSEWAVTKVSWHPGNRGIVDISIRHLVGDAKSLTIEVLCDQFAAENPGNGSDLTDRVFSFSICLMEFCGIRGFDEFSDGERVPLIIYPDR
jgi:hypothetical protein